MQDNTNNHLDKLEKIIKILKDSSLINEAKELEINIESSFTSTEICSKCGYLLSRYKRNSKIQQIIGNEINDFLNYCFNNGIHITP
jgi:hypothetical protein